MNSVASAADWTLSSPWSMALAAVLGGVAYLFGPRLACKASRVRGGTFMGFDGESKRCQQTEPEKQRENAEASRSAPRPPLGKEAVSPLTESAKELSEAVGEEHAKSIADDDIIEKARKKIYDNELDTIDLDNLELTEDNLKTLGVEPEKYGLVDPDKRRAFSKFMSKAVEYDVLADAAALSVRTDGSNLEMAERANPETAVKAKELLKKLGTCKGKVRASVREVLKQIQVGEGDGAKTLDELMFNEKDELKRNALDAVGDTTKFEAKDKKQLADAVEQVEKAKARVEGEKLSAREKLRPKLRR